MKDCVTQIIDFVQTINLNDAQQEKLINIVLILNTCICRLSNEVNTIKKQLIDIKHENQAMKTDEKENVLQTKFENLLKEIDRLKTHASEKILEDVYAHLLIPLIHQLKQELEKKKKEENDPKSNLYDFKNCYNGRVLDQIKTTAHVKGLVFFSKHSIEIIVDKNQEELLNKLVKVNIEIKTNHRTIKSIIDEYLYVSKDDTRDLFRMPIAELYKDMGTIATGKIESGRVCVGDQCLIMPNRTRVQVINIYCGDIETDFGVYEETVRLKLINIEDSSILRVDLSLLPSTPSNYPRSPTNIFVCHNFYMITFSSAMTQVSLDGLSKKWHLFDNHLLQVCQVELRPAVFPERPPEIRLEEKAQFCTPDVRKYGEVPESTGKFEEVQKYAFPLLEMREAWTTTLTSWNQPAQKVIGIVKWFNVEKGFGIINRDDNNEEIFVDKNAIVNSKSQHFSQSLDIHEKVEFDVKQGKKGYQAVNATRSNDASVQRLNKTKYRVQAYTREGSDSYRLGFRGRGRGWGRGIGRRQDSELGDKNDPNSSNLNNILSVAIEQEENDQQLGWQDEEEKSNT
ncbi:unnamed protein product, partial [Rotaria magnacalcarata]